MHRLTIGEHAIRVVPANQSDFEGPGLFFTGTDTGVGKTVVTAAVARVLRDHGETVRVCKPIATGATWCEGRLTSEDTLRLARAVGPEMNLDAITPRTFAEPVAPSVAARLHGEQLLLPDIAAVVNRLRDPGSLLLVEGIGGLLCPLTEMETVADLVAVLGLPLVIVARRSLGTLNHTLLTLEAARARGLPVAGVVVNETVPPDGLADETNVEELRRRDVPVLAVVPFQVNPYGDPPAALAAVDWRRLCLEGLAEKRVPCRR